MKRGRPFIINPLAQSWGDLVPVSYISRGVIQYRCTRIKPDGTVCGATRDLEYRNARKYSSCEGCGRGAKGHGNRGKRVPKMDFTAEQMERYLEILNGRQGGENAREAIEILRIEIRNEGACCKVCREGRHGEAA